MFQTLCAFLAGVFARLDNQSGQIPSAETLNYDALLSTTLKAYRTKLADNITRGNKYISFLKDKGKFRKQSGGTNIAVPLMHAQNGTADIYSGYGLLDTTPQDGITEAFYEWSQLSVSITISNKEKKQNKGDAKILDLLQAKTMQSEVSLKELLNACLIGGRVTTVVGSDQIKARIGRMDSGATGPLPLGAIIDVTPSRSVAMGNINGGTYSFWRNQAASSVSTTFVGLKNEMNKVYDNCTKGTGGNPDIIVGDQVAWETYWLALQQNERYIINDKKTVDILGGGDALSFRGSLIYWDELTPDPETPYIPFDATGTAATASTFYFVNADTMEFVVESDTDFDTTPFMRPENQDASVAQVLWMGGTGCNNRRKNGVLYGIGQTITS